MNWPITTEQAIEWLRKQIGTKTQQAYAESLGVSAQYLSDVLNERRDPEMMLRRAGLERCATYAPVGWFYTSPPPAPQEPLHVFSKGPWLFEETGQRFTGEELDAAAFEKYRALYAAPAPDSASPLSSSTPPGKISP